MWSVWYLVSFLCSIISRAARVARLSCRRCWVRTNLSSTAITNKHELEGRSALCHVCSGVVFGVIQRARGRWYVWGGCSRRGCVRVAQGDVVGRYEWEERRACRGEGRKIVQSEANRKQPSIGVQGNDDPRAGLSLLLLEVPT